jgi:hypothetical protein
VIDARKEAEQAATAITVKAESEREAAENLAAATKIQAQADAEAAKIKATGALSSSVRPKLRPSARSTKPATPFRPASSSSSLPAPALPSYPRRWNRP